jgi:hypothetical protein
MVWLWNQVDPAVRARSKLWYVGEIKELIIQKLMEWGLKVVPADAPSLESVEGGRLASPASQVPKAPT